METLHQTEQPLNQQPLKVVKKLWGKEVWIVNNDSYCLKALIVSPGTCCSLHYHPIKDETFIVNKGHCGLQLGDERMSLRKGDQVRILPGTPHRFWVPFGVQEECVILEVSTHHDDNDVVRIEESKILSEKGEI